jgi:hypothetical protein
MATRARIGIKRKDGSIMASYSHWDGYPGGLGYNLCENWENPTKVTKAIKLGNASKWGVIIGEKHDFDADRHSGDYEHMNCYYMRDRGEKDQGPNIYRNEADYIKNGFRSGEQYVYLLKDVGDKDYLGKPKFTWYYVESRYTEDGKEVIDDAFKPLEEDAIRDHIDILQRTLHQMKLREVA